MMKKIALTVSVILLSILQSNAQKYDSTIVQNIAGTEVTFKLVFIPAGSFMMGSAENEQNRSADEGPQQNIEMKAFYMLETEVTWDLYDLYLDQTKGGQINYEDELAKAGADAVSKPSQPYLDPSFGMGKKGFPAVSMTQFAALNFCKWLTSVTGRFYRLPTEAEWEYACRAGTTTAYYFGDDPTQLNKYAWYFDNSNDKYHEVAQKLPNAWGLYDMHGNVAEWTLDQYQVDFYSSISEPINPWRIPDMLHPRTVRGGSYYHDAEDLRSANRIESSMNWKKRDPQIPKSFWWNTDSPFVGFRILTPADEVSPEEIKKFWSITLDE